MNLNLSIKQKLYLAFALGPLILVIVGWIAFGNIRSLTEARVLVTHTYAVLQKLEAIEGLLVRAESAQRGYVVTADEYHLADYRKAVAEVDEQIEQAAAMVADNPRQRQRLASLKPIAHARIATLERGVNIRRSGGDVQSTAETIAAGEGTQQMQAVHNLLEEAKAEERALLSTRDREAEQAEKTTSNVLIYGILAAFAVLGIAGFIMTNGITRALREAVDALASASAEILAGSTQQASGMRQQSAAVAETVTTVDEVLQTSEQSAQRAKFVADSSQRAVEVSNAGRKSSEKAIELMGAVNEQTRLIAENILALAEQAQSIGEITASVDEMAEQTNLLALNAALEASRAGEYGRGFSIVAGEIKALAEQSRKATAQVRQILGDIQRLTSKAVMVTEQGTKSVDSAIEAVAEAGTTIESLVDAINDAAQAAAQISASTGQQATGMSQIHRAMSHINQAANQNLAATRQSEQAARDLNELGVRLKQLLVGAGA